MSFVVHDPALVERLKVACDPCRHGQVLQRFLHRSDTAVVWSEPRENNTA
jgi:hypothetical protein